VQTRFTPPIPATARLTIDLRALAANWRRIAGMVAPAEASAVVKADGYGLGTRPVVEALAAAGCRTFFVARIAEGLEAREATPDATIYVFDGAQPETYALLVAADLRPVLGSMDEIDAYARLPSPKPQAAIHVDTGMNRLGLSMDEARTLSGRRDLLAALRPSLVMSHLACADVAAHPKNAEQLALFGEVRKLFPGVIASLSSSGGAIMDRRFHADMVRPGIALYGAPFAEGHAPLDTVVTAEARILQVRTARAGETVGYGAAETLARDSRLAILGAGYADGYLRQSGSSGEAPGASVAIRGRRAPLVGRVSMDLMAADITCIPGIEAGELAELFGPAIPIGEVAGHAKTIAYELLTDLGSRFRRIYVR
jgi:alanine racemase